MKDTRHTVMQKEVMEVLRHNNSYVGKHLFIIGVECQRSAVELASWSFTIDFAQRPLAKGLHSLVNVPYFYASDWGLNV